MPFVFLLCPNQKFYVSYLASFQRCAALSDYEVVIPVLWLLQVQPYLHKIVIGGAEETVAGKMQKLIRNISGYQM